MSEERALLLFWHLGSLCDDIFSTVTCTLTLWTCLSPFPSLLVLDFCFELGKKATQIPKTTPYRFHNEDQKWKNEEEWQDIPGVSLNIGKFHPGDFPCFCQKGLSLSEWKKKRALLFLLLMGSLSGDLACSHLALPRVPGHVHTDTCPDSDKTAGGYWGAWGEGQGVCSSSFRVQVRLGLFY